MTLRRPSDPGRWWRDALARPPTLYRTCGLDPAACRLAATALATDQVSFEKRAVTEPSPLTCAVTTASGATGTIGPSAPDRTTCPARSGSPSAMAPSGHGSAWAPPARGLLAGSLSARPQARLTAMSARLQPGSPWSRPNIGRAMRAPHDSRRRDRLRNIGTDLMVKVLRPVKDVDHGRHGRDRPGVRRVRAGGPAERPGDRRRRRRPHRAAALRRHRHRARRDVRRSARRERGRARAV